MIVIFILITLLAIFVIWRLYYRKKSDSNRTSFFHACGKHVFTFTAWIFSAAIFIAVMYPMVRSMFLLSFLGSAALIWIGWDQKEDAITAEMNGSPSGWKTFKKPMRTFGFFGVALSGITIIFVRCIVYLEQNKYSEYIIFVPMIPLGIWLLFIRKKRKLARLNEQKIEVFRDNTDKVKKKALDTFLLLAGWAILAFSTLILIGNA